MFSHFKANLKAGITVATVALPLSLSLSIASGAGPTLGIITSIWAGIFASILGSSKFNIVGTAGALTALIASYVLAFSQFGLENISIMILTLPLLTIVTAGMILVMYAFSLHKYFHYIPSSVMYGFAAGVAILIAAGQIKDIVSISPPSSPHILENLWYLIENASSTNFFSVGVFVFGFFFIVLWKKNIPQFPAVLPITIVGILMGLLGKGGEIWGMHFSGTAWFESLLVLGEKFPKEIALILENPFSVVFQFPNFSAWKMVLTDISYLKFLFLSAFVIALISVLETIITAKLADKMMGTQTDDRKEILGLGIGTFFSGLAGGLPASGVFIRTGLNARSGAKGKMAGIVAAIVTGFFAVVFLPFFQFLPMAIIAAMLFHTAIGLLELEKAKEFWENDKKNFVVYVLVALTVFLHDASIGILLGSVIALLVFVEGLSEGQHSVMYDDGTHHLAENHGTHLKIPKNATDTFLYSFEGMLVYLNSEVHEKNMQEIAKNQKIQTVILRFRHLFYVDLDGEEMLIASIDMLEKSGKKVIFTSISNHVKEKFGDHPILKKYIANHQNFKKTREAFSNLGYPELKISEKEMK